MVITENKITIDESATRNRKEEIEKLTKDLWK
jgi:hypothetical protein